MVKQEKEKYENWINPQDSAALKNANLFTKPQLESALDQVKTKLQTHHQAQVNKLKEQKQELAENKAKLQKELDQTKRDGE
jgi:hypothetical protein